jgi:hypothetical protein
MPDDGELREFGGGSAGTIAVPAVGNVIVTSRGCIGWLESVGKTESVLGRFAPSLRVDFFRLTTIKHPGPHVFRFSLPLPLKIRPDNFIEDSMIALGQILVLRTK